MKNCVIYIDYDNIKIPKYDKIINNLFKNYKFTTKIFINEYDLNNLDSIIKFKYNIILCNSPAKSKNSTDISLTIECMKDIYSNLYDIFIIISNDTDFIPLCKEIKSKNKECYLCFNGMYHDYLNEIYDKTYNLSQLLKLENDKIKKELEKDNLEKDKIIQDNKLILILKNDLDTLLNIEFKHDVDLVTFDRMQKILKNNNIDFRKDIHNHNIKLKKFLELYLPNKYIIKNTNIYLKQ